jgi:hypothetical protein
MHVFYIFSLGIACNGVRLKEVGDFEAQTFF